MEWGHCLPAEPCQGLCACAACTARAVPGACLCSVPVRSGLSRGPTAAGTLGRGTRGTVPALAHPLPKASPGANQNNPPQPPLPRLAWRGWCGGVGAGLGMGGAGGGCCCSPPPLSVSVFGSHPLHPQSLQKPGKGELFSPAEPCSGLPVRAPRVRPGLSWEPASAVSQYALA